MEIIINIFQSVSIILQSLDRLFLQLFGPGRFLVYFMIFFKIAFPVIERSIIWQKYKAFVEDTIYKLNYGNLLKNEAWFMIHNYNNILQYAINRRDWNAVRKLKQLNKENLYEYLLEYARINDKTIKQIYGIR